MPVVAPSKPSQPVAVASRPVAAGRSPSWRRRAAGVAVLVLALMTACGFGQTTATPTPAPTLTPAPRPTAETPAAVNAWYLTAIDEGSVEVWADLTPGEIDALTDTFTRHYPKATVRWTRGTDEDLLQAALKDAGTGRPAWDVYIGHSVPSLKTARLTERWTPPEARGLPAEVIDPEGAWYAVALTYHVLQYNTELVPPATRPATYEALRDGRYFGTLAILDGDLTWLRGLVETRGRDETLQLLQPLTEQAVRPIGGARQLSAFVTAGQQAVAVDNELDVVERDRRTGGKTGWVAIEPVITQPVGVALAAGASHPNAARLFANFMLSPDAQILLALAGRVPGRPDVDPEPQTLVRGLRTRLTLPPQGTAERETRALWNEIWTRR